MVTMSNGLLKTVQIDHDYPSQQICSCWKFVICGIFYRHKVMRYVLKQVHLVTMLGTDHLFYQTGELRRGGGGGDFANRA